MWSRLLLSLLTLGSTASQDCFSRTTCTAWLDQQNEDLREQITDTLQREVENNLAAAPAAVSVVQSMFQDGLLPLDMSVERNEVATLESFWYQLKNFNELDWIYYGDLAGRFIGFRRAYPCEYSNTTTCDYGVNATAASPPPQLTSETLVRLKTGAGNTVSAYSTDPTGASGGDTVDLLYTETSYQTADRQWYKQGLADGDGWTEPYLFSGGKLGISYVKKIIDPSLAATAGVLAADYELEFLNEFINEISVAGTSTLFIVSASGELLANNRNASVTTTVNGAETIMKATLSENEIIRESTKKLFSTTPILNQPTANWSSVTQSITRGNTTINGKEFYYDSIGVAYGQLKWSVVIVSQESDFYALSSTPECLPWLTCRDALRAAAAEKRERKLNMLLSETRSYLGTAVAAVNTIDQSYNNGQLAAGWCDPCGTISLTEPTERKNLLNHIKHLMEIYSELIWLYIGFSTGQFAGYKRVGDQLKLWTCHPPNSWDVAGCTNVALYSSDVEPLVDTGVTDIVEKPLTKPWYTLPESHNLGQYELLWTDAYSFGTGEIGISAVKKGFGGDWVSSGNLGVWGADFSLDFLSNYISEFEVDEGVVLYILNEKKEVLAYAVNGEPQKLNTTLTLASQMDTLVRESAAMLRSTPGEMFSQLLLIDESIFYVNSMELTDKDPQLAKTYTWEFVMVTPEDSLYNYDSAIETDDDGSPIIAIIVICSIVAVAGISFAIWKFKCSESSSDHSDSATFFSHPNDDNLLPTEMQAAPTEAYQRHLSL